MILLLNLNKAHLESQIHQEAFCLALTSAHSFRSLPFILHSLSLHSLTFRSPFVPFNFNKTVRSLRFIELK